MGICPVCHSLNENLCYGYSLVVPHWSTSEYPLLSGLFVCVEVLQPSQPNRFILSTVIYLPSLLLGKLSPLSGYPVLCAFFRQKLTTALLESAEVREWPQKVFHDQSPGKNVANPAGAKPANSWSPVARTSNWATKAGLLSGAMCTAWSVFAIQFVTRRSNASLANHCADTQTDLNHPWVHFIGYFF